VGLSAEQYAERRAAFRDLRYATVQGAGHMLHHDQPEEVARLIEEFLLA
jgi:pimeloyl-ACP methyl ester carboxylesterase